MTDLTRVYAFKSIDEAAESSGYWKGRGYHVAVAGPTDAVRLAKGTEDPDFWESGEDADWYVVLASKASLEVVAKKTD